MLVYKSPLEINLCGYLYINRQGGGMVTAATNTKKSKKPKKPGGRKDNDQAHTRGRGKNRYNLCDNGHPQKQQREQPSSVVQT